MFIQDQPFAGKNIANVKAHNLQAILLTLLYQGPVSRARMAELTGLSTTTITNLMAELLAQGIVAEEGREASDHRGAGRPRISVTLVPTARYAVGIHLDVDNVRVALADIAGHLGRCYTMSPRPDSDPNEVLGQAADLVEQALAEAQISRERVIGAGVGASGLVDPETGVNVLAPNLGWHDLPIGSLLRQRLGLPVVVENNVRAMALAESMFGAGRNVNSLACVYARVGVGAGLVVGGSVYRGSRSGAGEIGHTTVIPVGGTTCRCGNAGCLETVVSEPAILKRAQQLADDAPDSILAYSLQEHGETMDQVFAAARAGDQATQAMLRECAQYMGTALANLINLINPDMIILGGMLAAGQGMLLPDIEATMRRRAFGGLGEQVDLRPATFGSRSGVLGAASLALDAFFYRQAVSLPAAPIGAQTAFA